MPRMRPLPVQSLLRVWAHVLARVCGDLYGVALMSTADGGFENILHNLAPESGRGYVEATGYGDRFLRRTQ